MAFDQRGASTWLVYGIGVSYDDRFLDGLAQANGGQFVHLGDLAAATAAFEKEVEVMGEVALTHLVVNLEPAPDDVELFPVEQLPALARRQLRGARRVTDVWPLSKGPCLRRSLVAGHLLRRYRPAVRIGVTGSGDDLVAHAWIEIDDRPLERVDAYRPFQHHPVSSSP